MNGLTLWLLRKNLPGPEPDGPNADMHGLRFDNNTFYWTWLQTEQQESGAIFTYSVWLKPTNSTAITRLT